MDADKLRDMFSRGMGNAARVIGDDYDVFRNRGTTNPLAFGNRNMRLPELLDNRTTSYRQVRGFERVLRATCDGIALKVGDYLSGPRGTLFVAALPPMERALCVLTTDVMDVLRPSGAINVGLNSYGGVVEDSLERVLSGWPAQMTLLGSAGQTAVPAGGGRSSASILLPITPVAISPSDLLQSRSGRRYLVRSCELSEMGWYLSVFGTET